MNREKLAVVYALVSGLIGAAVVPLFVFAAIFALWLLSALFPIAPYLLVRKHRVALALAPNVVMAFACSVLLWLASGGWPTGVLDLVVSGLGLLGMSVGIGAVVIFLLATVQWLQEKRW